MTRSFTDTVRIKTLDLKIGIIRFSKFKLSYGNLDPTLKNSNSFLFYSVLHNRLSARFTIFHHYSISFQIFYNFMEANWDSPNKIHSNKNHKFASN